MEDRHVFKDRRTWYAVASVIIVLIIIGYATGWFGGEPAVVPPVSASERGVQHGAKR